MKSRHSHRSAKRSRWAHANTPEALRRRRAKIDARREAIAAALRAEVEALQDSCEAKSDRIDRLGERVEKDTALLRQALDSMHPAMQAWAGTCEWHGPLKEAIAALRERLGDTAMTQEK